MILPIIGIIVVIFIIFKVGKAIIKGILALALIVIVIMVILTMADGTPLLKSITPEIQAQVQQQTANRGLSTILQKLKSGLNPQQIATFWQNSQAELAKYGLNIDSVKHALPKSNQGQ
ncbi:MAG: hypothetical protein P4L49_11135 [Desulfosporosinus sp.]|nr:hypothetical protein [Desulfosporosinus sp.]